MQQILLLLQSVQVQPTLGDIAEIEPNERHLGSGLFLKGALHQSIDLPALFMIQGQFEDLFFTAAEQRVPVRIKDRQVLACNEPGKWLARHLLSQVTQQSRCF